MSRPLTRVLPDVVRTIRDPRARLPTWNSCRAYASRPRTTGPKKDPMSAVLAKAAPPSSRPSSYADFSNILDSDVSTVPNSLLSHDSLAMDQPHRLHVFATKHNTHITLTRPPESDSGKGTGGGGGGVVSDSLLDAYKPPPPNQPVFSFATGMIGFRKSGRGEYDAAFQLASFVMKQIHERGLLPKINKLEVVLRGFGAGREASVKVLLGQEGRYVRKKITAVTDATRLKFGGSRSPNPRRLG